MIVAGTYNYKRAASWLDSLGISDAEASRILTMSRKAEDDGRCQSARIDRIIRGVAIVERWDYGGSRLPDVQLSTRR